MGLEVRARSGSCVVARMPLREDPFPTPSGALRLHDLVLATVGADRIKCLRPRGLFQLPQLAVGDCRDRDELEARIRTAWQRHQRDLARAGDWLRRLEIPFRELEQGSVLGFAVEGEAGDALVTTTRPHEVMLPGRGPLSGATLERAEDRTLRIDPGIDSAIDLSIAVSNRLEELARIQERLRRAQRHERSEPGGEPPAAPRDVRPRIVVVGPVLCGDRALLDSLRLRGYETLRARSEPEAMRYFATASPELILSDARLDRLEGIDLIPAVRRLVGIEEIPVVLVDPTRNEGRRDAARRAGAAGYVTHPIDVPRIEARLDRIVRQPRRRRFTRYAQHLSASVAGTGEPVLVREIGRGGMLLRTDAELPSGSVHGCRVRLPDAERRLEVEAEVVYRRAGRGGRGGGLGLRFRDFRADAEPALIDFLGRIDPGPTPAPL